MGFERVDKREKEELLMGRIFAALAAALLLLVASPCRGVVDAGASAVIGSDGGSLEVADPASPIFGARLVIPPGALSAPVVVSLRPFSQSGAPPLPQAAQLLGGIDITPRGLELKLPAALTVPVRSRLQEPMPENMLLPLLSLYTPKKNYYLGAEGRVTAGGDRIEAQITVFAEYLPAGQLVDGTQQKALKEELLRVLSSFLKQYEGTCFHDKKFVSLGDIDKIARRLKERDLELFIEPGSLRRLGADALYVDFCTDDSCPRFLFNDLVLPGAPSEVSPQTLYHETLHALFDPHDEELKKKGMASDEALTWYMETSLNLVRTLLLPVEEEYAKARSGAPFNRERVEKRLDLLVKDLAAYRADPGALAGPGPGGLPPVTPEVLAAVEELTGFSFNPETVRKRYLDGECLGGGSEQKE